LRRAYDQRKSQACRHCFSGGSPRFDGIAYVPEPAMNDENAATMSDKLQFVAGWT
jgi:hypothetical protein